MKLTHKLGGAALVAVAGVALAIPNTTKATDSSFDGTGKITFTYDAGDITIVDPGTTETATTITSGLTSQNPGEMGLIAVTPLEFGTHKSITSTGKVYDYYAQPFVANPQSDNTDPAVIASNTQKFETAHFVTFQDFRPEQNHDYKISAKITDQFATRDGNGNAVRTINGAKLTYNNAKIISADSTANYANPGGLANSVEVTDEAASTFISNGPVTDPNTGDTQQTLDSGYGRFHLTFGDIKATDTTKASESIALTVPNDVIVASGEYSAVITWTMSDTI